MAINFGSNETFIENYKKLKSSRKMGELYGCSKGAITAHADKIGYDYSNHQTKKITNIPIEQIIQDYKELGTLKAVAEKYKCSDTAVRNYLIQNNYPINSNPQAKLTEDKKDLFIQIYNDLKSADKVGEYFNCSSTTVLNFAEKIGYDPNSNKDYKLSEKDKIDIISKYDSCSSGQLAKDYNVSRGMITKVWYDANKLGKNIDTTLTTEIDIKGQRFGYWTVLEKTERRNSAGIIYWLCRCDCGVEREVTGSSLRNGTSLSCGHTTISHGNEKIKKILLENQIPFETEKRFITCKDKSELPFDFYVNNSYLIEYDGSQHYDENSLFGYETTHTHDLIKSQWCKDNNIPLIRIPYTHFNKLSLIDLQLETSPFVENNYADYKSDKIGETPQNIMGNTEVID